MRLHRPPHRWGPPPKDLLVSTVQEAPSMFLHAEQDAWFGTNGWSDAHRSKVPLRVEQFVLQWFRRGCGRREVGWDGMHCEGSWVAALAEILFPEVFRWNPDADHVHDHIAENQEPVSSLSPLCLWLSPFQFHSLDVVDMPVFSNRRKQLLQQSIERLQLMSNTELRAMVAQRVEATEAVVDPEGDDRLTTTTTPSKANELKVTGEQVQHTDTDEGSVLKGPHDATNKGASNDNKIPAAVKKRPRSEEEEELLSESSSSESDDDQDGEDDVDDDVAPPLGQSRHSQNFNNTNSASVKRMTTLLLPLRTANMISVTFRRS